MEEILSEKPYIKARVQPFQDYSENSDVLDQLEQAVFDEVRTNVQVTETMKITTLLVLRRTCTH